MVLPVSEKVLNETPQVTPQVQDLLNEDSRNELQHHLGLADRENFRKNYLQPTLEKGLIEMTIPEKPQSSKQRYRLTARGKEAK